MGCNFPIPAHKNDAGNVRLWPKLGTANLQVPCGNCLGCLTAKANEWAARATHEASQHEHNIFVTLTYDDDKLPTDGSLHIPDLQKFWKRLRKQTGTPIRYLACGEYGETTLRPHYHAIIFGLQFQDQKKIGDKHETSETLDRIWNKGHTTIGKVTPATAKYVAKYQIKQRRKHHVTPDGVTLTPPFLHMSRKPRIGAKWLRQYQEDLQHGYIITGKGSKTKIPRAYLKQLQKDNPQLADTAQARAEHTARRQPRKTADHREANERILWSQLKRRTI